MQLAAQEVQKQEKRLTAIKEKYEAGDHMHPQWSTQGPQPLGGIVTVIASLALQIVFTNFLLSIKSHSNLDEMGINRNEPGDEAISNPLQYPLPHKY